MKLYRTTSGHVVMSPRIHGRTGKLHAVRLFNAKTKVYCFEDIVTNARIHRKLEDTEVVAVVSQLKRLVAQGIEFDMAYIRRAS